MIEVLMLLALIGLGFVSLFAFWCIVFKVCGKIMNLIF